MQKWNKNEYNFEWNFIVYSNDLNQMQCLEWAPVPVDPGFKPLTLFWAFRHRRAPCCRRPPKRAWTFGRTSWPLAVLPLVAGIRRLRLREAAAPAVRTLEIRWRRSPKRKLPSLFLRSSSMRLRLPVDRSLCRRKSSISRHRLRIIRPHWLITIRVLHAIPIPRRNRHQWRLVITGPQRRHMPPLHPRRCLAVINYTRRILRVLRQITTKWGHPAMVSIRKSK